MERHAPGREAGQQILKNPPRPNESMAIACKSAANLLPAASRSVQRIQKSGRWAALTYGQAAQKAQPIQMNPSSAGLLP
jgi:hypothetical protein